MINSDLALYRNIDINLISKCHLLKLHLRNFDRYLRVRFSLVNSIDTYLQFFSGLFTLYLYL